MLSSYNMLSITLRLPEDSMVINVSISEAAQTLVTSTTVYFQDAMTVSIYPVLKEDTLCSAHHASQHRQGQKATTVFTKMLQTSLWATC